jgi:hypothetical protein
MFAGVLLLLLNEWMCLFPLQGAVMMVRCLSSAEQENVQGQKE